MTIAPPQARFDSPEQEAFLNLWRTYDRLRALEDELFVRWDLTPQQYNSLRLLKAEHPATLPTLALADRLVSRAPDITRLLDKLEARGLIARERPADNRRVVRVGVTPAGLTSTNYTISYVSGTLSVTPAGLTVTADPQTKAYGAANPPLTVSYSGFVNGDTVASLTTSPTVATTATA